MKTLASYVAGRWHEADRDFQTLVNPSTEEPLARASSSGVDFAGALAWARATGGPALRALTFAQRGEILKALSKVLREHRDELLDLSRANNGTTEPDGAFDVDGATGTLAFYGGLGIGARRPRLLADGDGAALAKTDAFWAQHVLVPRQGVAVHVNAFNFPAWGFAEKARLRAARRHAGDHQAGHRDRAHRAPDGRADRSSRSSCPRARCSSSSARPATCSTGSRPQDVLAFTGSAATALQLRGKRNLLAGERPGQRRGRQPERRRARSGRRRPARRSSTCSSRTWRAR